MLTPSLTVVLIVNTDSKGTEWTTNSQCFFLGLCGCLSDGDDSGDEEADEEEKVEMLALKPVHTDDQLSASVQVWHLPFPKSPPEHAASHRIRTDPSLVDRSHGLPSKYRSIHCASVAQVCMFRVSVWG